MKLTPYEFGQRARALGIKRISDDSVFLKEFGPEYMLMKKWKDDWKTGYRLELGAN